MLQDHWTGGWGVEG